MSLKNSINLSSRISESERILAKFPDRIPVIVESADKELTKLLKKNKFLSPTHVSVSYLLLTIRKQMKLDSSVAVFLFCDNKLLCSTELMSVVYNNYLTRNNIGKNHDKFLYITICKENTFGF
jgi:GABA(A) receptor-associated protein